MNMKYIILIIVIIALTGCQSKEDENSFSREIDSLIYELQKVKHDYELLDQKYNMIVSENNESKDEYYVFGIEHDEASQFLGVSRSVFDNISSDGYEEVTIGKDSKVNGYRFPSMRVTVIFGSYSGKKDIVVEVLLEDKVLFDPSKEPIENIFVIDLSDVDIFLSDNWDQSNDWYLIKREGYTIKVKGDSSNGLGEIYSLISEGLYD